MMAISDRGLTVACSNTQNPHPVRDWRWRENDACGTSTDPSSRRVFLTTVGVTDARAAFRLSPYSTTTASSTRHWGWQSNGQLLARNPRDDVELPKVREREVEVIDETRAAWLIDAARGASPICRCPFIRSRFCYAELFEKGHFPVGTAMEPVRITTGLPVSDRLLWYLAWNRRPLYVLAGILALVGAISTHSPLGLLFGLLPLALLFKANQLVNAASPQIIETAKAAILKAGTQRVGVELENSNHVALLIPDKSGSPFGIRPAPQYTLSCVYITDAFFAVFPGTSFSLPARTLTPATTAEEIYFRHVSAINQRDGYIEITLNRGNKPKRIDIGNDPGALRLLDTLRTRLRSPGSPLPQPISPTIADPPSPAEQAPLTITASNDERYCYIRSSKLMEYYSDPTVINALIEQLQVPGTAATHNLMTDEQKKVAIETQIEHFSQTPASFWYRVPAREILAASIWRCGGDLLSQRVIRDKFYDVAREEDLRRPVARWLQNRGEDAYMEIQLGRRRIDVLGYNKRGPRLTAVELKNSDEEFRRGPDQMSSFAEYAHAVYLACTPAFAADYLERNAEHRAVNHWDPTLLDRKLRQGGFGLLIVERDAVFEVINPVVQDPTPERLSKIISGLPAFHKIELD